MQPPNFNCILEANIHDKGKIIVRKYPLYQGVGLREWHISYTDDARVCFVNVKAKLIVCSGEVTVRQQHNNADQDLVVTICQTE